MFAGEAYGEMNGYGTIGRPKKNPITKLIAAEPKPRTSNIQIGMPEDFRRVSAIIDIDVIPESHRRVKLMKNYSDKPLGFYIRDGTSVRVTQHGLEKVPGIFISRLVPGGLAESTGLLAVNDEVLEVNGIEVSGKTLDQVTDMMVANSSNLIITVKPVNQRNNLPLKKDVSGRQSQKSISSQQSAQSSSAHSYDSDDIRQTLDEDEDIVHDHIAETKNSSSNNNLSESTNTKKDTTPERQNGDTKKVNLSALSDENITEHTYEVVSDSPEHSSTLTDSAKLEEKDTPIVTL